MRFDNVHVDLDFQLEHKKWEDALANLFYCLSFAETGDVVTLIGPSRVGKTRLIRAAMKLISDTSFSDSAPLGKPFVMVNAKNSGPGGRFITKQFIDSALRAANHPILSSDVQSILGNSYSDYYDRNSESKLQTALGRLFKLRNTRYFVIDEAHHIGYASDRKNTPQAILDGLKCFAADEKVVLVLVGAYPLLDIISCSPHLCGRASVVHLPRYLPEQQDLVVFRDITLTYANRLGLDKEVISGEFEQLYSYSLGCIGLIRKWLVNINAKRLSLRKNLTPKMISEVRMPKYVFEAIRGEIVEGECRFYSGRAESVNPNRHSNSNQTNKSKKTAPFKKKPKRHTPGERGERL